MIIRVPVAAEMTENVRLERWYKMIIGCMSSF